MKVLAIDDNKDNLTALTAVMRDALPECEVFTALNGPEGIALARTEDPDVVLLDIVMPEMDGFEVCRRLKADAELSTIPVIFLTALQTDRESRIKAINAGGDAFLAKPLDEQELIAAVRSMAKAKEANCRQRSENERLTTLVAERTRALELELAERRKAEEKYQGLFREMIDAFALHDIICDEAGKPIDYRFLAVNPAFERMTGLTAKDVIGRTVMDVMPRTERHWIETYGRVALTGQPACFESYAIEMEKHFAVAAFRPSPNQFACTFIDITERKLAEEQLRASELKRRRLFETMSEGAFYQLADGALVDVNSAALQMFGLNRDEFLGRTSMHSEWDVIREDGTPLPGHEHPSMQALSTGKPLQDLVVGILNPQTKAYTWVSSSAIPEFRKGEDTPYQVVVTMHDITARKQTERALRESEERQRDIIESIGDWVWETDENGVYTYASPKCLDYFGQASEGIIGKTPFDFMAPEEARRVGAIFSEIAARKGHIKDLENWNLRKDGEKVCLLTNGVPILDDAGGLKGYRGVDKDITARKLAEKALQQAQAILQAAMDQSTAGIAIADAPGGELRYVNDAGLFIRGGARETVVNGIGINQYVASWKILDLDGRPLRADEVPLSRAIMFGETCSRDFIIRRAEGDDRVVLAKAAPIRDESGKIAAGIVVFLDITEARRTEQEKEKLQSQLAQAQKMESVGRLAGGVAHDFNNLLMGMLNYVELCRDKLPPEHPIRPFLAEITNDANRSADLTRQLLAFARKQIIAPRVLDMNEAVGEMRKLLGRLLGENISLTWFPGPALWKVKLDPSQVDQILANLCVNARDAIAGVGRLNIETCNITADEPYCAGHAEAVPGEYVLLTVSDTGHGMSKDVLAHIFEPFFTTKELGKGTGLGLATVFGIVTQNKGFITVYSEPGKGTTFKIHLPRCAAPAPEAQIAEAATKLPRGTETILLVEDEKSVRVTTKLFLEDMGYKVLVADHPGKALTLAAQHPDEIHLLITDVIMPNMSGSDLAGKLCSARPSLKRLFISGFTADIIAKEGVLESSMHFLTKPFGRDALARKVREVLEGGRET